jgi:hypothetical protein
MPKREKKEGGEARDGPRGLMVVRRITQKANYDLPASLSREIGRVIVRWAHFESHMQNIIYAVAFNRAENAGALGRLAIRELKPDLRADLLADIAHVQGVGLDRVLLKAIRNKAEALGKKRNLLAHGIWTLDQDAGWVVRETRGNWGEEHPTSRGRKRSIEPESVPMNVEDVRQIVAELDALMADAKKL